MKNLKGWVVVTVAGSLLGITGCTTKHIVERATDKTNNKSGIHYSLPRSVVVVDLPVTRIVKTRSSFWDPNLSQADFDAHSKAIKEEAQRELGIPADAFFFDAAKEEVFKYGAATITSRAEADPEQVFFVRLKGGFLKNRNFNLKLTEDGLISSAESRVEDKTLEFAMKSLESVAKVAGSAMKAAALGPGAKSKIGSPDWAFQIIEYVKSLRKARVELLSGINAPASISLDVLKHMLEELDKQEALALAHLTGIKEITTKTLRFEVRPSKCHSNGQSIPLVKYYKDGFAVEKDAAVSYPAIPKDFDKCQLAMVEQISLELRLYPDSQAETFKKLAAKPKGERSYYYRMPATVLATLKGSGEIFRTTVPVAQFGEVLSLPPHINNSSSLYKPTYYVNSGALQELNIQGSALDTGSLAPLSAAAAAVADPIAEKNKLDAAANDELEQLKRQAAILEQKKKIQELQGQLQGE